MSQDDVRIPALDPAQFAAMVRQTPDDQLAEGFAQNRKLILDEIFARMPESFEPSNAGDVSAVVEWRILDAPGGGSDRYQLVIEKGSCRTTPGGEATPAVAFEVKPVDFVKLVTGNAAGPELFMTGRLKIEGDLMLAARVQSFFRVPRAESAAPADSPASGDSAA